MADENVVASAFLHVTRDSFRGYKKLGDGAFAQLRDEDFFYALDKESNSLAVIIKHLSGNLISRWTDFLTTDGEKPTRNRDQEFEMAAGVNREQLMQWWERGWNCAFQAMADLQPADLTRTVYIRGEPHSVTEAITRSLCHCAYHVGQIIYLSKHIRESQWKPLSIPKGKSAEFNASQLGERKIHSPTRG